MIPPQNPEHTPVCEKHKDCHLMISCAKECFWPPCVRIGCHKHRQYIDEVAPALTEKQRDKLESRSQRVDWRVAFEEKWKLYMGDCKCNKSIFLDLILNLLTVERATVEANAIAETREEMIKKIEEQRTLRPTNTLNDVALAMRREESLSKGEIDHIKHRDNGLYIRMVTWAEREKLLDALLNNLKEDV